MTSPEKPLILVCDDEEGVRESYGLILSDDYQVRYAHNGLEAIELFKTISPKMMFLDIKMPKISGMDILKKIKAVKPQLNVVIVTGYQSSELEKEAIKSGASGYVCKPFESADILRLAGELSKS